jgi:hypothetical protein
MSTSPQDVSGLDSVKPADGQSGNGKPPETPSVPPIGHSRMAALTAFNASELTAELRQLRAEAQGLAELLLMIGERKTSVVEQSVYLKQTATDLAKDLAKLKLAAKTNDNIQRVVDILEQMGTSPLLVAPEKELSADEQGKQLALMAEYIRKFEFWVGICTIPEQVNKWLAQQRPGYYLPFHEVFGDEIPNANDRQKMLNFLTWSPNLIEGGVVDLGSGLIYRHDDTPEKQKATYQLLAKGIGIALLVVLVISLLHTPLMYPTGMPIGQPWWTMLSKSIITWLAVIVGMVVHIAVDVAKGRENSKLPTIFAIGDAALILNARSGELLWKLLLSVMVWAVSSLRWAQTMP